MANLTLENGRIGLSWALSANFRVAGGCRRATGHQYMPPKPKPQPNRRFAHLYGVRAVHKVAAKACWTMRA